MGTPHLPEPSLLFIGLLYSRKEVLAGILPRLDKRFGDVLIESQDSLWDHSRYYNAELGTPIYRRFIVYRSFFDPTTLPAIKLETNEIESEYSVDGQRMINLDPGYLMVSRVILASAKDYSHRIYLGQGIYGEVALFYQDDRYHPLPYTYYDYRNPWCLEFFASARRELKRLKSQVR